MFYMEEKRMWKYYNQRAKELNIFSKMAALQRVQIMII